MHGYLHSLVWRGEALAQVRLMDVAGELWNWRSELLLRAKAGKWVPRVGVMRRQLTTQILITYKDSLQDSVRQKFPFWTHSSAVWNCTDRTAWVGLISPGFAHLQYRHSHWGSSDREREKSVLLGYSSSHFKVLFRTWIQVNPDWEMSVLFYWTKRELRTTSWVDVYS